MMYVTVPLDGHTHSHVFGLRLDKASIAPDMRDVRTLNPTSPLNRRALLDLQLGADSALRLELDRRLTLDFTRKQWHESSLPATFTLSVPTREKSAPATQVAASSLADLSALTAALVNPFQYQSGKPPLPPLAHPTLSLLLRRSRTWVTFFSKGARGYGVIAAEPRYESIQIGAD